MQISCEKNGGELTIAVSGRLDTKTAPELEKTIPDELPGVSALTFDLNGLTYTSSAGLRVFLIALKTMKKQGGTVRLINVCRDVLDILEMTGFTDLMTVES